MDDEARAEDLTILDDRLGTVDTDAAGPSFEVGVDTTVGLLADDGTLSSGWRLKVVI